MEIKILQGINLINPITTIDITTDAQPNTTLLDLVKSFHPIFMDSYSITGNSISIQSKLPHLWKEIAPALNKQSTKEWSDEQAKQYILETVIKNQISSMSTIPILYAAHRLGYETTQFYISEGVYLEPGKTSSMLNRYYKIGIGRKSAISVSAGSSGDAIVALKTQRDKTLTNIFIDRLSLPIAPWEIIESEEHLTQILDKYQRPVVIKPVGLTGGNGVTTNIRTIEQAVQAYRSAQEKLSGKVRSDWQTKIMIQQQVTGEDYRLLVVDGILRIATKRIPAYVIGDGQKSIRQLIEVTNSDPRRDISNPSHILKPIKFDEMLDLYLQEQSLTLEHVPEAGQKINVRKVASMSQGGVTEDFTEKVHPQIRYICESIASSINAFVLGVDLICNDISKPLTIENGSFIEMNTMPEMYLNAFPTGGRQYPEIGEHIVNGLISHKGDVQTVVVIGHRYEELNDILQDLNLDYQRDRIGVYTQGKIYINGELINEGLEPAKAVESLKLNSSLSVIVLLYPNLAEVEQLGTGFDRIDTVVSTQGIPQLTGYQAEGLIKSIKIR